MMGWVLQQGGRSRETEGGIIEKKDKGEKELLDPRLSSKVVNVMTKK